MEGNLLKKHPVALFVWIIIPFVAFLLCVNVFLKGVNQEDPCVSFTALFRYGFASVCMFVSFCSALWGIIIHYKQSPQIFVVALITLVSFLIGAFSIPV